MKQLAAVITLAFMLLFAQTFSVNALDDTEQSEASQASSISALEDLLRWHDASTSPNDLPTLASDVTISQTVILKKTKERKDLGAIEHVIRVTQGGNLIIDNECLAIMGPDTVIIVEEGGRLVLSNGALYTAEGSNAVVIEKGGQLTKSDSFQLHGGGILDHTSAEELPAVPVPPNLVPAAPRITSVFGLDFSLVCTTGEPPAPADYPSTAWVAFQSTGGQPSQLELPVQWELETVDFQTAGTYEVKGIFTAEVLQANNLCNPDHIVPTLWLTVHNKGPLLTLTGSVLAVGSKGDANVRLALPSLPEGVTALYLYRSADGQDWEKAEQMIYENGNTPLYYDNFLPYAAITPEKLYLMYRFQTDYRPLYLRVEVEGSPVAGITNEVKLQMPAGAGPGNSVHPEENEDDGSSGGNRGGGGQYEADRDLKPKPEQAEPVSEIQPNAALSSEAPSLHDDPPPDDTEEEEVSPSQTAVPPAKEQPRESAPANVIETPAPITGSPSGEPSLTPPEDIGFENKKETPLSKETQQNPKPKNAPLSHGSRGVRKTAGLTFLSVCGILLIRFLSITKKHKSSL